MLGYNYYACCEENLQGYYANTFVNIVFIIVNELWMRIWKDFEFRCSNDTFSFLNCVIKFIKLYS